MSGISEALVDNGVSVFLCNVEDDPRRGQLHVEAMLDKRVDGIIATGKRIDRRLPVDLSNLGIPAIYALPSRTPRRSPLSRTTRAARGLPSSICAEPAGNA